MELGRKILNLRRDRGLTQQRLAQLCDITASALSKIEAGINSPRANVLWNIAGELGVSVEYLLDESLPYPYQGHEHRRRILRESGDPEGDVQMRVTREEKAYLEALRESQRVAVEIAYSIPHASLETIRMIHFLLHHARVKNPNRRFFRDFESLLTGPDAIRHRDPIAAANLSDPPAKKKPSRAAKKKKPAKKKKAPAKRTSRRTTGTRARPSSTRRR